jgi:hypothetical protein
MRNILFTAVLAAGIAGCVGGIDSPNGTGGPGGTTNPPGGTTNPPGDTNPPGGTTNPPGPTTDAGKASKAAYDATVDPILRRQCIGCHKEGTTVTNAPAFVATDMTNGYAVAAASGALVGDLTPAGAPILTLILQTGHQSQQYTAADQASITKWLALELAARKDGTGAQLDPVTKLENNWSSCMTLADFSSANMIAWATVNSNDNGNGNAQCQACHNLGEDSFAANVVPDSGFALISQNRITMKQYFTVDSTTAPTKIVVNTANIAAVGTGTAPGHIGHRRFNLTANQGATAVTALTNFYNLTMAKVTAAGAAGCGAPKFVP